MLRNSHMINCFIAPNLSMNRLHKAIFLALMVATMSLAGCFGNEDDGNDSSTTPDITTELDDWNVYLVGSASDLPSCTSSNEGALYYVADDAAFYVCASDTWTMIDLTGATGAAGANGAAGQNGANGQDGADGQDGLTTLATTTTILPGSVCTSGGSQIDFGIDSNLDGVLQTSEVTQTNTVCNGQDATLSSTSMLTRIEVGAPTASCQGGVKYIHYGQDDGYELAAGQAWQDSSSANGILEDHEIDFSSEYCLGFEYILHDDLCANPSTYYGCEIVELASVGDKLLFVSMRNLYAFDTTTQQATLLTDSASGLSGMEPEQFLVLGEEVYFVPNDVVEGIYNYNSTTNAITQITSVSADGAGYGPYGLMHHDGVIYYFADDSANQRSLMGYDVSQSTSSVLASGFTRTSSDTITLAATDNGDHLFFSADDGTHGSELWAYTLSNQTAWLAADVFTGSEDSFPQWLTYYPNAETPFGGHHDHVYFNAYDDSYEEKLQAYSLENHTAWLVDDMGPSEPRCLYLNDREIFFDAYTASTGSELYSIEPQDFYRFSVLGIELVEDIHPGTDDGNPCHFTPYANMLFFSGTPDWNTGREILGMWGSNYQGLLKDLNPTGSSWPSMFTPHLDSLFFVANDGSTGEELWEIRQTQRLLHSSPPDVMLTSVSPPDPSHGCDAGGRTIAQGLDNGDGNDGIAQNGLLETGEIDATTTFCSRFVSDDYNLKMVKDIRSGNTNSYVDELTEVGNTLFFTAHDGYHGYELWKSDGTAPGTVMVKDIASGQGSSPTQLTAVGNTLFFTAFDGIHGYELWKSDGTASGTVMVKDIYPGGDSSVEGYIDHFAAVGNTFYFRANDGINGHELWKSDGTSSGTVMVKDINSGSGDSDIEYMTAVGNTLYFRATDGTNGRELWKSDGTASGTVMVKDIRSGSSGPRHLTAVDNTLYFRADDGTNGGELWKSDGTSAGTVMVKDIRSGIYGSEPQHLTSVGSALYFVAYNDNSDVELWKSDGTASGTVMVKDIWSGSTGPVALTAVGNTLYFSATDGTNGYELWKSDGTASGTVMVKDIRSGIGTSSPDLLTAVGNTLYFRADDGTNGGELWKSDGTASGTVMVKDIVGGSGGSFPLRLTAVGNALYFEAYDGGTHGRELYTNLGVFTEVTYT